MPPARRRLMMIVSVRSGYAKLVAFILALALFLLASCGGGGGTTPVTTPKVPDTDETYGFTSQGKVVRFQRGATIDVFIEDGTNVDGFMPAFAGAARTYILKWNSVGGSYDLFTITTTDNPGSAEVRVRWVESLGGNLAGRTSYTSMGRTLNLPVEIELPTHLAGRSMTSNDVSMAAIHEMGHALGLWQHSPHLGDVMYPIATSGAISKRDIATIYKLYHTPADITSAGRGASSLAGERVVVTIE